MQYWDTGHPYRFRTWIRSYLPWWVINLGLANKSDDCQRVGGEHWWYNLDDENSGCYHCYVERPGRLWQNAT